MTSQPQQPTGGTGNTRMVSPTQRVFQLQNRQSNSDSFFEDAEPRPPPRIPQFSVPFDMTEMPRPMVPDVSLIFDSASAIAENSKAFNFTNSPFSNTMTPAGVGKGNSRESANGVSMTNEGRNVGENIVTDTTKNNNKRSSSASVEDLIKKELSLFAVELKNQNDVITKLDEKLDSIIQFQEKFLSKIFLKEKNCDTVGSAISKEVQTDNPPMVGRSSSSNNSPDEALKLKISKKPEALHVTRQIRSDFPNRNRKASSPSPPLGILKGPLGKIKTLERNEEDLSAVLKDIQLPNMNEPSVFSEHSGIKSLELQEFNDDSFQSASGIDSPTLGTSASAYGSNVSSEDEETQAQIKPTATFYNNVLGNVNRLLEGGCNQSNKRNSETRSANLTLTKKPAINAHKKNKACRERGLDSSGVSESSNSTSESKRNGKMDTSSRRCRDVKTSEQPETKNDGGGGGSDEVVEATKRYLETLGVQFESPLPNEKKSNPSNNSRNYMIQQNVYNSIYIPTVNCAPLAPDALDSNANSSNFNALAHKYVPTEDLMQFENLKEGRNGTGGRTDATVYGMSPNNLSFATKDYLQRYGLVNQNDRHVARQQEAPYQHSTFGRDYNQDERVLDINAIRNQPKLL